MKIPPYLKPGSTIAIASTARFAEEHEINEAKSILTNFGFNVMVAPNVTTPFHRFAGDDESRARGLQQLLDDKTIDAIWFARGGYGTLRVIDNLNWTDFNKHPKWLIGFSDMTVLHLQLHHLDYCSLHACTVAHMVKFGAESENVLSVIRALKGEPLHYEFPSSTYNKPGKAKGRLLGGNLSMVCNSIGSSLQPSTENCILLLEDVNEYLYHYERMLFQLSRSGLLKNIRGLIIGRSTINPEHDDIEFGFRLGEIVQMVTKEHSIPIVFNAPFGHTDENYALCLGKEIAMEVDENTSILKQ